MIQGVVKHRDFIARSKDCLPTRLHLLEIYHGSQHSEEDNEGAFSSIRVRARARSLARAIEGIAINREPLIGFDRRPATLTAPKSMGAGKLDEPQFPKVIRPPRGERSHPTPGYTVFCLRSRYPLLSTLRIRRCVPMSSLSQRG